MREQVVRDPLTGLYNRRYFSESLEQEVEKCKRYDYSVGFIMLDINRFKEINDRYSHQTGDEVLKEVAGLLKDNVRDADVVVRYGGDEFLIMMSKTKDNLKEVADRINEKVIAWNEQTTLIEFPLTLAMGVSSWGPNQDGEVQEAIKEADRKMYEEKDRS